METSTQIINIASTMGVVPGQDPSGSPNNKSVDNNEKAFLNIFGEKLQEMTGKAGQNDLSQAFLIAAMPNLLNTLIPGQDTNNTETAAINNPNPIPSNNTGDISTLLTMRMKNIDTVLMPLINPGLLLNTQDESKSAVMEQVPSSMSIQNGLSTSGEKITIRITADKPAEFSRSGMSLIDELSGLIKSDKLNKSEDDFGKADNAGNSKIILSDIFGKPANLQTNLVRQFAGLKPIEGLDETAAGLNVRETYLYNEADQKPTSSHNYKIADILSKTEMAPPVEAVELIKGQFAVQDGRRAEIATVADKATSVQTTQGITQATTTNPEETGKDNSHNSGSEKGKEPVDLQVALVKPAAANTVIDKTASIITGGEQKAASDVVDTSAPTVRFVIPPELNKGNVKNGQVIVIKMEPENLGQLRLILSTHHDTVNGRLIVENNAVRTVVESNLGNLYDQLSRQGIRLENFEVSLNAGQSGQRFGSGRSSDGPKSSGRTRKYLDHGISSIQSLAPVSRGRMYIGAAGVNWMA